MQIYRVQWKEDGKLVNTDIKANSLDEAKMKAVHKYNINPKYFIKEEAWK